MHRLLFIFLLFSILNNELYSQEFYMEAPQRALTLCRNHPYATGALIYGAWIVINYMSQEIETDEAQNLTEYSWVRALILGLIIDELANGEKSLPSKFLWVLDEYSKRSIFTFIPVLAYESISGILSKFF